MVWDDGSVIKEENHELDEYMNVLFAELNKNQRIDKELYTKVVNAYMELE